MVDVAGVSHSYDGRPVLRDITFQVNEGEIVVIMGSSGGGKTTLLKCIAGLLRPTEGGITVDGVDVVRNPEQAHSHMGFVFQYAALFDSLTVRENVLFGLQRQRRLGRKEADEIVREHLEEVGLPDAGALIPSELSGGMRKRVGLARALALQPKVILYDEPTSGLDPVTAYAIDELIVETRDRHQTTSIVVSHDVTSVLRVADRIAFLEAGELVFWGEPKAFLEESHRSIRELVTKSRTEVLLPNSE